MEKHKRRFAWAVGRVALLCVAAAAAGSSAGADETFYCDQYITSVPYVIGKPGHYCLNANLATSLGSGVAITIAADFVWLDLNNYALDGSAAGRRTAATGILAMAQNHVTVRNGTVRGFQDGINLGANQPGTGNVTIEGIHADQNTYSGISIWATGEGNVVRGNRISNTGGNYSYLGISGISVVGDVSVLDNDVVNSFNKQPGNYAFAISFANPPGVNYRAVAVNNRVTRSTDSGIACNIGAGPQILLRDNIVVDAPLPYSGCTMVGATNYP